MYLSFFLSFFFFFFFSSLILSYLLLIAQVRLVNGRNNMEGRVEVLHHGLWGTVCHRNWNLNDADVVCRMLGYGKALGAPGSAYFGQGSGLVWLDKVGCLGTEDNIAQCKHAPLNYEACGHNRDAGVICGNEEIDGKPLVTVPD